MFSHEERAKEIQLFLKYDFSYTATIRDLVYPSVGALREWYKEYLKSGTVKHNKKTIIKIFRKTEARCCESLF